MRQMHAADARLIKRVIEGAQALHRAAQLREEVTHAVELISQQEEEVLKVGRKREFLSFVRI